MPLSAAGWIIVMVSIQRRPLYSCSSSRTHLQDTDQNQNIWAHHTSPQVHTLPSSTFRIDFKVLLLVYKSLNGLGPKYTADMLTEYKPNRALRSLGSSQLETPRVHTKQGSLLLAIMKQLPEEIRCAETLNPDSKLICWMSAVPRLNWLRNYFLFLTVLNSFKIHFYII